MIHSTSSHYANLLFVRYIQIVELIGLLWVFFLNKLIYEGFWVENRLWAEDFVVKMLLKWKKIQKQLSEKSINFFTSRSKAINLTPFLTTFNFNFTTKNKVCDFSLIVWSSFTIFFHFYFTFFILMHIKHREGLHRHQ